MLKSEENGEKKKPREKKILETKKQKRARVIKSTHRILKKTNNAERGIVLRAEERGVRGSSERHDQKMRGDARDERYARALFFVSISLSLSLYSARYDKKTFYIDIVIGRHRLARRHRRARRGESPRDHHAHRR